MSWKVGLGHSENDLEIQGEIDFDFFDDDENTAANTHLKNGSVEKDNSSNTENISHSVNKVGDNISKSDLNSSCATNDSSSRRGSLRTKENDFQSQKNDLLHGVIAGSPLQSRYPKKVIETVIPNLEEPEVVNIKDTEDDAKADDSNPSSSSVSMTDSDGMSSLSGDLSDSESITDVTPLHSPYCCDSPLLHSNLTPKKNEAKDMEICEKKEAVRFSEDVQWESESKVSKSVDLNVLVAAIKKLEVQQQSRRSIKQRPSTAASTSSSCRTRKNMSFSNAEVRRIDQENQRLLKCIVSHQTRSKSSLGSSPRGSGYLPSSQVNRQRKQRQIQMDNVALLKRIESAKPSRELSRSHLLREHNPHISSASVSSQSSLSRPSSSLFGCRNTRSYSLNSLSSSNDSMASPASLEHSKALALQAVGPKGHNSQ